MAIHFKLTQPSVMILTSRFVLPATLFTLANKKLLILKAELINLGNDTGKNNNYNACSSLLFQLLHI